MSDPDNVIYKAMLWGVKMGMAQAGDPVVVTSGVLEEQTGVSLLGDHLVPAVDPDLTNAFSLQSTNIMRVLRCAGFEVGPSRVVWD